MEFDFVVDPLFPEKITRLNPNTLKQIVKRDSVLKGRYKTVIDSLGNASARAQCLPTVITLFDKFLISDSNQLFVLKDDVANFSARQGEGRCSAVVGFLKIGPKDLFLHDEVEELIKVRPLCVLDFYVHENCQRRGYGKELFDYMLSRCEDPRLQPRHLAYDRPSDKLIPFLKKHYELGETIPQFNKFLIASGFFDGNPCNLPRAAPSVAGRLIKHFPYESKSDDGRRNAAPLKKWFSDDCVSLVDKMTASPRLDRPKSELGSPLDDDSVASFENVSTKSLGEDRVRFSRHLSSPSGDLIKSQFRERGNELTLGQESEQSGDFLHSNISMGETIVSADEDLSAQISLEKSSSLSEDPYTVSSPLSGFTPERDWTSTPRKPIGTSISNRRGLCRDPLSPSASTVSNAFIWMPASTSSNHRVRAPYATTSPKAEARTAPSSQPPVDEIGNKRFQRTSLW